MSETFNTPRKKQPLSPTRFFIYWVLLHLGISLLGDIVWGRQVLFQFLIELVIRLRTVIDTGGYLWRPLIVVAITSIYLIPFYWLQKRLLSQLFHVKIKRWILLTWLGWVVAYIVLDSIRISMTGFQAEDIISFNIRFGVVLVLVTVLTQWWLLRQELRAAWAWVAAHLAFLLGTTLLIDRFAYSAIQLFSTAIFQPLNEYLTLKFMALLLGIITGGALLWIRQAQAKTKSIGTNATIAPSNSYTETTGST